MASWCRKRGTQVVVFIRINNKNKQLPRSITKHLDGQPDHNVEHWIREWEEKNGAPRPLSNSRISDLVDRYLAYMRVDLERDQSTVSEHGRHLNNKVIPFFLSRGLHDPNLWGTISVQLLTALRIDGATEGQIFRCNVALRHFYKWLAEEQVVYSDKIMIRAPNMSEYNQETPLKVFLTPEQVIRLADETSDPSFVLALLVGYFCCLRSQEVFGLRVGDFRIGQRAKGLECSKTMKTLGLFDGMVVYVERQKDKKKKLREPKKGSTGWVCCHNREAAVRIVKLFQGLRPDEFISKIEPNKFYNEWPFDFTPKDMRRAGLYWLGHSTEMGIVQLMKHSRQKSIESLFLYLRRPEEALEKWTELRIHQKV